MSVKLVYDGVNLTLFDNGVSVNNWVAISGGGDNQAPQYTNQKLIVGENWGGPTPEGSWRIDVVRTSDNVGLQDYPYDDWGGVRWRLNKKLR